MANIENLMPIEEVNASKTPEERIESASKAGIASGKARKNKKMMKDTLETLLSMRLKDEDATDIETIKSVAALKGKNISVQEAIMLAQIQKAMKGDTRAAEFVRDASGNKIAENLNVNGTINNPLAGLTTDELRKLVSND